LFRKSSDTYAKNFLEMMNIHSAAVTNYGGALFARY